MKQLKSNFTISHDQSKNHLNTASTDVEESSSSYIGHNNDSLNEYNNNSRSLINEEISNNSNIPTSKLMKTLDLSSSIHGSDFYQKSLKGKLSIIILLFLVNTNDRDVKLIEIKNPSNFDKLDTKELKSIYAKQG